MLCLSLCACGNQISEKPAANFDFGKWAGNYVTEEYTQRAEGYDWMVVSVSKMDDTTARIEVRSRTDKKKPSCTYESRASVNGENQLIAIQNDQAILFSFKNGQLSISTAQEEDKAILQYYCSGGGSMAGTYTKLEDALDESQLTAASSDTN